MIAEARPDLVLTDVVMPGVSGLDLLGSARSDPPPGPTQHGRRSVRPCHGCPTVAARPAP